MRAHKTSFWILALGAIAFCVAANFEATLVAEFWQQPFPWFRDVMSRSIYEGRSFGGSDVGVTLAIICFLYWLFLRYKNISSRLLTSNELKFIWISSVITSFLTVHSLKWIISRARPKFFFNPELFPEISIADLSKVSWPGFMPWDGPRGLSWNSFPSGHTASCAILLAFCYVAWPKSRPLSVATGIVIALLCVGMAIARSMAGMHWLSDSVASFFITWSLIHAISIKMRIHES